MSERWKHCKVGARFWANSRQFRVVAFLDEPNRGLANVEEVNHPLKWTCTMFCDIIEHLLQQQAQKDRELEWRRTSSRYGSGS